MGPPIAACGYNASKKSKCASAFSNSQDIRELRSAISEEECKGKKFCVKNAINHCNSIGQFVKTCRTLKKAAPFRAGKEPCRVMAVGDTIISEQGLVAIIGRDPRDHVCGAAHTFEEANRLVRQHRPDVLLIEPFLENPDAIRWIQELATGIPRICILLVS